MKKLELLPLEKMTLIWDAEERMEIELSLRERHKNFLKTDERFFVEIHHQNEIQMQFKIALKNNDGSFYYPLEVVLVKEKSMRGKDKEIALQILDYVDMYWFEYLTQERDVFLTLEWSEHHHGDLVIFMRGFVRNLKLEDEAEKLFQIHGHGEHFIESNEV